jgi:hypothetical protein
VAISADLPLILSGIPHFFSNWIPIKNMERELRSKKAKNSFV